MTKAVRQRDLPLRRSSHGHSSRPLCWQSQCARSLATVRCPWFPPRPDTRRAGHTPVARIGPHMDHKLRRSSSARLRYKPNLRRSRPRWASAGAPCILHGRPLAPTPTGTSPRLVTCFLEARSSASGHLLLSCSEPIHSANGGCSGWPLCRLLYLAAVPTAHIGHDWVSTAR
jgi:hypothetical protein